MCCMHTAAEQSLCINMLHSRCEWLLKTRPAQTDLFQDGQQKNGGLLSVVVEIEVEFAPLAVLEHLYVTRLYDIAERVRVSPSFYCMLKFYAEALHSMLGHQYTSHEEDAGVTFVM